MRIIALQSGSNGNCIFVEALGVRLLLDAGIPGYAAQKRLAQYGIEIASVDALLISHEHSDHVRSMGVFHRQFGLPIHITKKTLSAARTRNNVGELKDVHPFEAGATLTLGPLKVETIPTPHDAVDGVAFVVDDGRCRLGILTDLGHVFADLRAVVRSLDAVILESNYDPDMLDGGSYPDHLKRRIRGPGGHLSNAEAADLLAGDGHRLRWACLAHLSERNNAPTVATRTHRERLRECLPLHVASRFEATDLRELA